MPMTATSISEHVCRWFDRTATLLADSGPNDSELLLTIGAELSALARDPHFEACLADPDVHCSPTAELGRSPSTGATMYLMADPAAARSAPHRHDTWAVTVGLAGIERNVVYQCAADTSSPAWDRTIDVLRGTILCMTSGEGHSTEAVGGPTRLLHLFGRSLDELAPFEQRLLHF